MVSVLIVEDDKAIAKTLELRLRAEGFAVDTAYDAATAAMVARRCSPDVAVLDISMPGGDGFLVAERLRAIFADVGIVFLTANSHPEMRARALSYEPRAFLNKPYSSEELVAAVAAA